MLLTLDNSVGSYHIRSYEPGKIKINEITYENSVIITPQQLLNPWQPQHFSDIALEHLNVIFELSPTVVIIGTGTTPHFATPVLMQAFLTRKIGLEVMETGAACRTYQVLMSEGRNVVAALLLK